MKKNKYIIKYITRKNYMQSALDNTRYRYYDSAEYAQKKAIKKFFGENLDKKIANDDEETIYVLAAAIRKKTKNYYRVVFSTTTDTDNLVTYTDSESDAQLVEKLANMQELIDFSFL